MNSIHYYQGPIHIVDDAYNIRVEAKGIDGVIICTSNDRDIVTKKADFVVKALNLYDELVDALYDALPCVEESDEFNKPSCKNGPKFRKLIAKIEGLS